MEDKIIDLCMDVDINDAVKALQENFKKVKFVDEKIDDGLDDGDYLMMSSYDVDDFYVRLYYPQQTREVTDIQVYEN